MMAMTSLVELNPFEALPIGCLFLDYNFYMNYLIVTLAPLVVLAVLGVIGWRKPHTRGIVETAMLTVIFLLYPGTAQKSFRMFKCMELDVGRDNELRRYLRTDLSVDCDTNDHRWMQCYAGSIICVYTLGVPLWLSYLFFRRHRATLLHLARMEDARRMQWNVLQLKRHDARGSYSRQHGRFSHWLRQQQHEVDHRLRMLMGARQRPVGEARGAGGGEVTLTRMLGMHNHNKTFDLHKADEESLPLVVRRLVHGYAFHAYWYELFECFRKVLNNPASLMCPASMCLAAPPILVSHCAHTLICAQSEPEVILLTKSISSPDPTAYAPTPLSISSNTGCFCWVPCPD